MKLIYFDESKNDNDYEFYHIGGICIDESDMAKIEKEVTQLSEITFSRSELIRETEFHASDIYHRKNNFKKWTNFDKRISILERFMAILSSEEVHLIDIQINCNKLSAGQNPKDIAFMFFGERANDLVRSKKSFGMLIGDRENDRTSELYAKSLSSYRSLGTEFRYGRNIKNLIDSVHFTHSHLSRFLQLSDIYTWFLQFRNRNKNSKERKHLAILNALRRDEINLFPVKYKSWPKD